MGDFQKLSSNILTQTQIVSQSLKFRQILLEILLDFEHQPLNEFAFHHSQQHRLQTKLQELPEIPC